MAQVLIDTTYLLPIAGIEVKGIPRDAIRKIRASGHDPVVSEISLFELLAKGSRLVSEGRADEERVLLAVRAILGDEGIGKVEPYREGVARKAILLKPHHSDFVDCLILASAMEGCEMLVTEDADLVRNAKLLEIVKQAKPSFSISTLRTLLRT